MTTTPQSTAADEHLAEWADRQAKAEAMIPVVGRLYREFGVVTSIHGRTLLGQSPTDILKAHRFARRIVGEELPTEVTEQLIGIIDSLDLGASRIDLGRLAAGLQESQREDVQQYVREQLAAVVRADPSSLEPFAAVIADELNVKSVDFVALGDGTAAEFGISHRLQVNARAAGPRLGKQVQQAIKGAKSGDWSQAEDGTVTVQDVLPYAEKHLADVLGLGAEVSA